MKERFLEREKGRANFFKGKQWVKKKIK